MKSGQALHVVQVILTKCDDAPSGPCTLEEENDHFAYGHGLIVGNLWRIMQNVQQDFHSMLAKSLNTSEYKVKPWSDRAASAVG